MFVLRLVVVHFMAGHRERPRPFRPSVQPRTAEGSVGSVVVVKSRSTRNPLVAIESRIEEEQEETLDTVVQYWINNSPNRHGLRVGTELY